MRFGAWLLLSISISAIQQNPLEAQGELKGRIEHRNALPRVNRPAMPSRPLGEALEHVSNAAASRRKAGFDLAASSVSNLLDKHSFQFGLSSQNAKTDKITEPEPSKAKALAGNAESQEKELTIAWENWHKKLCGSIYHFWLVYGNIPGEGKVTLQISRNGDIEFDLQNFYVSPVEQFSHDQRELFQHSVGRTVQMLEHTDALAFPEHSQRDKVTLTTKFSFSETEDGAQGYTWKRGDYEKVSTPR